MARDRRSAPPTAATYAALAWAVAGVVVVFVVAVVRLTERGIATIRGGLSAGEWIALAVLAAAFFYGEGVRALERRWVPFVIRSTARLRFEKRTTHLLLAPLYAMGFVGAPRATLQRAWVGAFAIAAAVLIVRALPEPWRGIVDLSVAGALAWGLLAIIRQAPRALR